MIQQETVRSARVDEWLANGGVVLTATDRAARSVAAAHHSAQRDAGRMAWTTPAIAAWDSWVRERWTERNRDGLLLLNALQEQRLWTKVVRGSRAGAHLLHPDQLAKAAQQAYKLLCDYAPEALTSRERLGWPGDAAIFSEWITEFESRCRREALISASRLVSELAAQLLATQLENEDNSGQVRAPLLLIGFDRVLDSQKKLLHAWAGGAPSWQLLEAGDAARESVFFAARDSATELTACVSWIRRRLEADPNVRLTIVTTNLQQRRGEIERALLEANGSEIGFEFSLGVPLGQMGVARAALLLLQWLDGALTETELDWLIASGHTAANAKEEIALAETMRQLRRKGLERTEWSLEAFANPQGLASSATGYEAEQAESDAGNSRSFRRTIAPPEAWTARLLAAKQMLRKQPERQSPLAWADAVSQLLEAAGWPGFRPLSSTTFQARQRWDSVMENCASLGFEAVAPGDSGMEWDEFIGIVATAVGGTIFAAESRDAAVQISEPLESAGQLSDGIWFLGADEESWPGRGAPHPLLPIRLQREAGMPHSTPQADWSLAQEATTRLLASANEVIFSYCEQSDESEARPSRLILRHVGAPVAMPSGLAQSSPARQPLTEVYEDASRIAFPLAAMAGGSATLTRQSLCPFQAFSVARLGAEQWQPAEAGLNAKQRGQLLHAVLHRIWSKDEGGLASLQELLELPDLQAFVRSIVNWVMERKLPANLRETLPKRFLLLEARRLTGLVTEWLGYEQQRLPFQIEGTEIKSDITVAGLTLSLRLDRVDVLGDGSKLVIDYKTGSVGPSVWAGERPKDVQLPLYASLAMHEEHTGQTLQGLVFARVRPGDTKFYGRARDAANTLRADLSKASILMRNPLTDEQLEEWRRLIHQLGEDFLHGRADVDPRDGDETCKNCELYTICRIQENVSLRELIAEEEASEADSANAQGGGYGE
ncbi:PD-(D/E)XK nuclease family protein [Acidicapsa ligni]|uniref:PD-(D/E)XK nuclease family protein n=1 Tax=Acidicapsa ligni TaxID=542300 RepID=UPI0021E0CF16|nr:PD-(D/E)XK nuclease family protein [Acidicapsa ligni]